MPRRTHYSITPLETLRHFGLRKTLQLVLLKGLRIRSVVLIARQIALTDWTPAAEHPIRRVTAEDGDLFEAAGFTREMLHRKLDEGPGWICVADGALLGWNFLATEQSAIADWLLLRSARPGAIWGTGTWVRHDQRGNGLAKQLRGWSGDWGGAKGYSELLGWIDLTNHSSRRSSRKLGAREIGRVTFIRRFGFALLHDGRRCYAGRWTAAHPLILSIDEVADERPSGAPGRSIEGASPAKRGGR